MDADFPLPAAAPSWKSAVLLWLSRGAAALFLLGLILRLTVRDQVPYLAALFYALPLPILFALAGIIAWLARRRSRANHARAWAVVTLVMALWCAADLGRWQRFEVGPPDPVRILFWNTCRGLLGWERVAEMINEIQPDIAGLVEAGEWSDERRNFWQNSCPGYHVSMLGGEFVCLTRQPAGDAIAVHLPVQGEYRRLDVTVRGGRITLYIVDLRSNPILSRRECLHKLATDADEFSDRPVVILGDFNTPSDSVHFAPLRAGHRHAFEVAGRGYLPTWPVLAPVLCLDHIWANGHIKVSACRHLWSAASDHRPVVADVTIAP